MARCYHRAMTEGRLLPEEWQRGPRYGGAYTFARCPPSRDFSRADVAIVGVPMDMAVLSRSGARWGPRAIRDASGQLRPHHWEPDKIEPPFDKLRVIDYGDIEVFPGYIEQSIPHITQSLSPIVEAGVFPVVLGGDHSTTLPVLRACASLPPRNRVPARRPGEVDRSRGIGADRHPRVAFGRPDR